METRAKGGIDFGPSEAGTQRRAVGLPLDVDRIGEALPEAARFQAQFGGRFGVKAIARVARIPDSLALGASDITINGFAPLVPGEAGESVGDFGARVGKADLEQRGKPGSAGGFKGIGLGLDLEGAAALAPKFGLDGGAADGEKRLHNNTLCSALSGATLEQEIHSFAEGGLEQGEIAAGESGLHAPQK